jgi:hypothetical protein
LWLKGKKFSVQDIVLRGMGMGLRVRDRLFRVEGLGLRVYRV